MKVHLKQKHKIYFLKYFIKKDSFIYFKFIYHELVTDKV